MQSLSKALILFASMVNLLPVVGVLSADRLQSLYGVALADANLVILMRHRAILFGIVGGLLVGSAFHPPLRRIGLIAGLTSMLSFVLIAGLEGDCNPELRRVVVADVVASLALLGSAVLDSRVRKREESA